ncbi:ataxin-1-like [Brienomyrus brachyistius]|uniref:ataxin-1-like n=1 Tax=Brienomyrus brachyistius TaxID=42636 RepID=UPI0020B206E8|nr:ataxin-1-like [Brienomyrus brachyistius]
MKSNQERSNECLPPKKREILALEEKPVGATAGSEALRGDNLAWLASMASRQSAIRHGPTPADDDTAPPQNPLPAIAEHSPQSSSTSLTSGAALTSLSAVYSSPLSQHGGAIQYAQLPPSVQFISPAFTGPYAGYISSQVISSSTITSAPAVTTQRPQLEGYGISSASRAEQHPQLSGSPGLLAAGVLPSLPHPVHPASQYVQIASTPLSVAARALPTSAAHVPLHLHPNPAVVPQTLTLAPSQVVVRYTDGSGAEKADGNGRELLNGEVEKSRHYVSMPDAGRPKQVGGVKGGSSQHQQHHYDARQVVLHADYAKDTPALRTSLTLVPNNHGRGGNIEGSLEKSTSHTERCGPGKPISRTSPFSFSSLEGPKAPAASQPPPTVIQAVQTTETLPMGLPTAGFYPAGQPPIIGYIAGASQAQQQPVSYHAGLPQHLLIPASQPLLIPVSSGTAPELEPPPPVASTVTQPFSTALPQAYVAATLPKCEVFRPGEHQSLAPYHAAAVVQTELHLPMVSATPAAGVLASPPPASPPPPSSCPSLPPYFMKGSIIQLADGELKRVEDLKTEDFIQSAEISGELKIDSSTVERIDGSQTPNSAIIQFAVGEHRAQVSVEVLLEYPFFVFGQGWSSCCPDRTTQLFELSCAKLSVGDVCISLTLKNLKNGSLRRSQTLDSADSNGDSLAKPHKVDSGCRSRGSHSGERDNGPKQWPRSTVGMVEPTCAQAVLENGELACEDKKSSSAQTPLADPGGADRPTGRKRRWSAPEGRQVEKSDEEPPLTLPKPSFIPQEVKICIEGRSIIGK